MLARSPSGIFDVAWRSTASSRSRSVHAAAVVDDANEAPAAVFDRDVDARRAGVERVLDELLDGGRRPLDHLARGDAIDENGIETANGHGLFGSAGQGSVDYSGFGRTIAMTEARSGERIGIEAAAKGGGEFGHDSPSARNCLSLTH